MTLDEALAETPIVAIIRGVRPEEVLGIAEALYTAGVRVVEVPLNSPEPLHSIQRLAETWRGRMVCGAGTVLSVEDVQAVATAGGEVVVSPNGRADVIRKTIELGMAPMPGFGTATEAFEAYAAGARRLKLFPAVTYGAAHVKQLKAVLPKDATVLAVGGVGADAMAEWRAAGTDGFGVGGEIYRPGQTPEQTLERARALVEAARAR
ncbi:MAG TPA: 2-dehydro-3-deoxy-6-phosphogalactonate aldolase [Caulobacteraceae bacterium]|jgi:2-dehydro-3-deoxyphosphogalactonate aldolase